jgi:MFS family permease
MMTAPPVAGVSHRSWARWLEPWFGAYGLVGVLLLGVGPMLIPLTVEKAGPEAVGLVVAAFYFGALFTPLFGAYADRRGAQRPMFLACFPIMAAAAAVFPFARSTLSWAVLAVVFGGAGAVAGMFVVEGHPRAEWNTRISWLRMAYGTGQVAGLLIAAVAATHLAAGWLVTSGLVLAGLVIGGIGLPALRPVPDAAGLDPKATGRPIGGISWALHAFHRPRLHDLTGALQSRFGVFLLTWLLTMTGVQTFFNVVPLVMRDTFGVPPSVSSLLFLAGAGLGTVVYPASGHLAGRRGPGFVLGLGLAISITAFAAMALAAATDPAGKALVGSAALVVAAVAYSLEVVGATMLVDRLTPGPEGAAMGLLNSAIAAGAIVGAIVPSFVADAFGYSSLPLLATGVLVLAFMTGLPVLRAGPSSRTAATATPPH